MKNKKIRMILKILTISVILIMTIGTSVFADSDTEEIGIFASAADVVGATVLSGFVGIILYLPKLLLLVIALAIQGILSLVLSLSDLNLVAFTPATMLFNQVSLLDVNFFSMAAGNTNSALYIVKENVAKWYVGLRNLSTAALLAVIAYIGIRMALSTVAEDKSKYKKLLRYWVESFALLFVLHYLMIAVINFNDAIVNMLYASLKNQTMTGKLLATALKPTLSGVAAAIVYTMTIGVAAAFFIMYLKRVMMIGFLIVIAPLITITYSIDKVGDGKSQALDQWLKLFMYNVLIQPFHCILYLIFVSQAFNLVSGVPTFEREIAGSILSIASMMFIFKAEEILKQIFGFDKAGKSMMSGLVAGAMVGKAAGKVSGTVAKGTGKIGKGVMNSKVARNLSNKFSDSKLKAGLDKTKEGIDEFKEKHKVLGAPIRFGEYIDEKGKKFGKDMTKVVPDLVIPTMVAPSSGSAAFGMFTSSLDASKQKRELEDQFEKLESEITSNITDILSDCRDDAQKEQRVLEAYSLDFSKSAEVMQAYHDAETRSPGSGMQYLKFAQDLQARVNVDVKLHSDDNKSKMESLQEVIDSVT